MPLLLFLIPFLTGCGLMRPTLQAVWCAPVPLPSGFVAPVPWAKAPILTLTARRGAGAFAETRVVQLKACTDGRALSILVRWSDDHDAKLGRFWLWDENRSIYQLQRFPIDQCAILLPLSKGASLNPWDGKASVCDVWQWRAGWSDLSGYADDRRLFVRPQPVGTRPAEVKGRLYPLSRSKLVELQWLDDSGVPGTILSGRPITYLKSSVSGAAVGEAMGSAADVRALGAYSPKLQEVAGKPSTWRYSPLGDDWFVAFYRLLVTASTEGDDCQLRGPGPFRLAVAIWDNSEGDDFYLTEPIRLKLARPE